MMRLVIAALVVLSACGDLTRTIDDPAVFLAELRTAECEHLVGCHLFPDAATCQARLAYPGLPFDIWISPPGEALWPGYVAAGTMSYSPEQAAACVSSLRELTCSGTDFPDACFGVFRGAAPPGTVTSSPDECAFGWEPESCGGECCAGTCAAGRGVVDTGSDGREGERCGLVEHGFQSCWPRLACREGTCVRLGAGDECLANIECPAGLACNGVCESSRAEGETCVRRDGEDTCDHVGLRCDATDHCRRFAVESEACSQDQPCRRGLLCDDTAGRCRAVLEAGAPCDGFGVCADGLFCPYFASDAVCTPLLEAGATCDMHTDCVSGACLAEVCAPVTTCP
jgi:hypothetical protein